MYLARTAHSAKSQAYRTYDSVSVCTPDNFLQWEDSICVSGRRPQRFTSFHFGLGHEIKRQGLLSMKAQPSEKGHSKFTNHTTNYKNPYPRVNLDLDLYSTLISHQLFHHHGVWRLEVVSYSVCPLSKHRTDVSSLHAPHPHLHRILMTLPRMSIIAAEHPEKKGSAQQEAFEIENRAFQSATTRV